MCFCEYIVAIVGVTAGHIDPVTQAVNLPAQKVLIAFVCLCVFFFFSFWFVFDASWSLVDILLSTLYHGDPSYG